MWGWEEGDITITWVRGKNFILLTSLKICIIFIIIIAVKTCYSTILRPSKTTPCFFKVSTKPSVWKGANPANSHNHLCGWQLPEKLVYAGFLLSVNQLTTPHQFSAHISSAFARTWRKENQTKIMPPGPWTNQSWVSHEWHHAQEWVATSLPGMRSFTLSIPYRIGSPHTIYLAS